MKRKIIYTPNMLNYTLFIIGMTIVIISTREWIPVIGAIIASVHISVVE